MLKFAIILDKPIPDNGRKPTARECERFRKLASNVRPTTSGAWTVGWLEDAIGGRKPFLHYHGRRSTVGASCGAGWAFEILTPNEPTTPTRSSVPFIPLSSLDTVNAEPTMCW